MVNAKLALFAILAAAATFVSAADDESAGAGNGTVPATNGTVLDDGGAANGTATNGTATNGTEPATNGTATNGTAQPTPSGGSTRRALRACEYGCPLFNLAGAALTSRTPLSETFACRFESDTVCTYQTNTGVLSSGDAGTCPGAALPLVAGCAAGRSDNGGVVRRSRHKRGSRRSSAEMQFEALVKRLGL